MATAKQLAALKKARAARAKNLKKKTPVKRKAPAKRKAPVKRKVAPKARKKNPIVVHDEYLVSVITTDSRKGFLYDWLKFDTEPEKGLDLSRSAAYILAKALKAQKLPNVAKVIVEKKP